MKLIPVSNTLNSRLFDHFFDLGNSRFRGSPKLLNPLDQDTSVQVSKVEVQEDELNFYVYLDLPGVNKKDLNIQFEDSKLNISASRLKKVGSELKAQSDIRHSITIGDQVVEHKVQAKLKNGVLEVILPKVEKPKAHIIPIQ